MNPKDVDGMKYYKRWLMLKSIVEHHEIEVNNLKGYSGAVLGRKTQLGKLLKAIDKIEEMYQ